MEERDGDVDERRQLIPYAGWVVKGGPAGSGCAWSGSGSSRVKGAVASLRDGLRPPLTREPLPTLGRAVAGRPGACPLGCAQPDPAAFVGLTGAVISGDSQQWEGRLVRPRFRLMSCDLVMPPWAAC